MSARMAGLLLWLLLGGMAAVAVFWQLKHPPQPPTLAAGAAKSSPTLPSLEPIKPFRLPSLERYGEILARPLFVAARKPEPPPPEEEAPPEKPVAGPDKKPFLLGVFITSETTAALLRPDEPNAKVARVKPGESVGEWRVETILPDRVVLSKGQTKHELPLIRLNKPVDPRAVAGRKPPPGAAVPIPPAGRPAPPQSQSQSPVGAPDVQRSNAPPPVASPPPEPME